MSLDQVRVGALPVYYDPCMVADAASFSPSAGKPGPVVASWKQTRVPIEIHKPVPVTREQFCLAHDPAMVDGILALRLDNGFGNRLPEVAQSLAYTTGAMLSAARAALDNGAVAVAPCSGFHHARYDFCGGYCTFNGLIVTLQVLKQEKRIRRAGILDFDMHYGDGTADCIERLKLDWIIHDTAGQKYHDPHQAEEFLASIPRRVKVMAGCDLILYQAGADPHIKDPLGGWLNDAQLLERDRQVFACAAQLKIPLAWNLAGGYQDPLRRVLDIHDNTLRACWAAYGEPA